MAKCASCGEKVSVSRDMCWQRFFPVVQTFCRRCFPSAARSTLHPGDPPRPDPDLVGVLHGREGGVS